MSAEERTFEQAQAELEQIVERLEQGKASLDEALALWEKGEQLYAFCRERLDAARQLFDLALGAVELLAAERVELLASLPERQRLVERGLALLEPLDDLLELGLRLLEALLGLAHRSTSSTRAPKAPCATRTSTRTPGVTSTLAVTTPDSVRTIAYPR